MSAGPHDGAHAFGDPDDLTVLRVDRFLPHSPAKVWRALTEPELIARWLLPGDFRLEVGHRYTMTALPRPNTGFSGTVSAEVLAYETGRMLRVRWRDAAPDTPAPPGDSGARPGASAGRPGGSADWTITWTLCPEGRGTRLFLVHEGFDPDDPAQLMAHKIMGQGWSSFVFPGLERVLEGL